MEPEPQPPTQERGTDAEIPVRPLTFEEFKKDEYKKYIDKGGQNPKFIPPSVPMNTMRERLSSVGRLDQFEAQQARRRRQRAMNPQILTDDVYRVRQRLAAQRVMNSMMGGRNIPKLTGEGHSNPTMEALGGKLGMRIAKPIPARVDTDKEVRDNTPL